MFKTSYVPCLKSYFKCYVTKTSLLWQVSKVLKCIFGRPVSNTLYLLKKHHILNNNVYKLKSNGAYFMDTKCVIELVIKCQPGHQELLIKYLQLQQELYEKQRYTAPLTPGSLLGPLTPGDYQRSETPENIHQDVIPASTVANHSEDIPASLAPTEIGSFTPTPMESSVVIKSESAFPTPTEIGSFTPTPMESSVVIKSESASPAPTELINHPVTPTPLLAGPFTVQTTPFIQGSTVHLRQLHLNFSNINDVPDVLNCSIQGARYHYVRLSFLM